jgi:hypothetical protein
MELSRLLERELEHIPPPHLAADRFYLKKWRKGKGTRDQYTYTHRVMEGMLRD